MQSRIGWPFASRTAAHAEAACVRVTLFQGRTLALAHAREAFDPGEAAVASGRVASYS